MPSKIVWHWLRTRPKIDDVWRVCVFTAATADWMDIKGREADSRSTEGLFGQCEDADTRQFTRSASKARPKPRLYSVRIGTNVNRLTFTIATWVHLRCILCQTGLSRYLYFLTSGHSDAQSECPDVKNHKWRLNPVWHRMGFTAVGNSGRQRVNFYPYLRAKYCWCFLYVRLLSRCSESVCFDASLSWLIRLYIAPPRAKLLERAFCLSVWVDVATLDTTTNES